jgi:hypothetical protein
MRCFTGLASEKWRVPGCTSGGPSTTRAKSSTCWSSADETAGRRCALMRKLLKKQAFAPKLLITDKLRSYAARVPASATDLPAMNRDCG